MFNFSFIKGSVQWRLGMNWRCLSFDVCITAPTSRKLNALFGLGTPKWSHTFCFDVLWNTLWALLCSSIFFRGSGRKRPGVCSARESRQISFNHKHVKSSWASEHCFWGCLCTSPSSNNLIYCTPWPKVSLQWSWWYASFLSGPSWASQASIHTWLLLTWPLMKT